jgi:hypothetical protein
LLVNLCRLFLGQDVAVRGRVEKDAEIYFVWRGVLMPRGERQVGIEGEDLRTSQPSVVVVKGEDFAAAALLAMQFSHQNRMAGMFQIDMHLNRIEAGHHSPLGLSARELS